MAWAFIGTDASGTSTASSTSVACTTLATMAVGRVVTARVAKDNVQTTDGNTSEVTSVTDTRGNTWTKAREFCNGQAGAGAGAVIAIYYTVVTTQIEIGDTVTAKFSSSITSKAIALDIFSMGAGSTVSVAGGNDVADDAADPSSLGVSGLTSGEYLYVRAIATESNTNTALTVTASHTVMKHQVANSGTSATSMGVRGEFIIATGTGDTSDPTLFSADHASTMVALLETPASSTGTLSVTLGALTLVGAGNVPINGSAAITLGALTLSGAGNVPVFGSLATTLGALTLAGAASAPATGTLATTLGTLTLAGTASAPATATLAITLGALALAGTGTAPAAASAAITLEALTLSGTGTVPVFGTLSVTLGALTASSSGSVLPNLVGAVPTGLTIRTYDGLSGAFIAEWIGITDCDITFGENGPEQASIGLPKTIEDGSLNPALDYRRTMPGMRGVLVEVDARGLDVASGIGVPDVWLGRATSMPRGSDKPVVSVSCQGPHSWLDRETVPARLPFRGVAGRVFRTLIAEHPNALHLIPGDADDGPALEVTLAGGSLWEAIGSLEEMTLGRAVFTAVPGEAVLVADWRDQLAARDNVTDRVVLVEGVNCEWDADCDLDPPFDTIAVAGRSFGDATIDGVVSARAPAGPVLGRLAALTAAVSSPVASTLLGQGGAKVRPDIGAASSLYSQADAAVRGQLAPPQVASITITDPTLWLKLRTGKIVETRFDDPFGIFSHALAEIKQITWGLAPERKCSLGVELWSVLE